MSNRRPSSKVVARGADGVSSLDSAQVASFASRSGRVVISRAMNRL